MGECRKFVPNVFNKAKCSNCFKQIGEHSSQAIEFHKVSKKVLKSGYLFVAPGWDFSNPLHRTKRWQRRWFVLCDDGELSYSVDDHPDTIPQAKLNLTTILEVTNAEEITGHEFSLAISAVDRVHFVKATCREDVRDWTNILITFQKNMARTKRSSTIYNGKIILKPQNQIIPINNSSSYTTACYHVIDNKNNCNYESKLICDVIDGRKTSNYLAVKSVSKTLHHSMGGGCGGTGNGGSSSSSSISNENCSPKQQLPNRRCDIIDEKMKNSKKLKSLKLSKIGNNLSASSAAAAAASSSSSSSSIITTMASALASASATGTVTTKTTIGTVTLTMTTTTATAATSTAPSNKNNGSGSVCGNISKRENNNRHDWFNERKMTDYLSKGKENPLSNGSSSGVHHYNNKTKEQPIMDKYNNHNHHHNHKSNGKVYETLIEPKINQLPNSDRSYGHLVNCSSSSSSTSSLSLLSSSSAVSSSSITNCYCASSSSLSSSSGSPSPPISSFASQTPDRNRIRARSSWNGHGNSLDEKEQLLENGERVIASGVLPAMSIDQVDSKKQNKSSESTTTTANEDENMFSLLNHKNGSLARLEFNENKMNGNQTLLFDDDDDDNDDHQHQQHLNCWRKGWLMLWMTTATAATATADERGSDDDGIGGDIDEDFGDGRKRWQKYWFVLCEKTLNSYRDQEAENVGDFIHSIDLNSIATVTEQVDCDRNYGFQILLHNGNKYLLSSLTKGIRANWVKILKHNLENVIVRKKDERRTSSSSSLFSSIGSLASSATLTASTVSLASAGGSTMLKFDSNSKTDLDNSVDLLSPETNNSIPLTAATTVTLSQSSTLTVTAFNSIVSSSNSDNPVTTTTTTTTTETAATRSNMFSSDDEYKTASEGTGGRRESEIWVEPAMHLPPSPLLNRTVLSKIKDRDRYRVNNKTGVAAATAAGTATENNGSVKNDSNTTKANGMCGSSPTSATTITKDLQLKWHLLFQKQQRELEVLNRKLKTIQQEKKQFEALMIQWDKRVNILNDFMKNIRDFLKLHCKNTKDKNGGAGSDCDDDDDDGNGNGNGNGNNDIDDCGTVIYQLKKCFAIFKNLVRKQILEISHLKETVRLYDFNDSYDASHVVETVVPSTNSSSSSISSGGGGCGVGGASNSSNGSEPKPKKLSTINRVDSLTDLTSVNFEEIDLNDHDEVIRQFEDLKQRFDKAISEIRLIKKELRESYKSFDNLELKNFSLNQDLKTLDTNYKSQINLMAERIQDLTVKLSTAEKQNRIFKSKVHHTKDKYRSLSLITNTESFLVQKEIEDKITNLENKINSFEEKQLSDKCGFSPINLPDTAAIETRKISSSSTSAAALKDPLKLIIKLNSLDKKLSGILSNRKNNRNHNHSVVDEEKNDDVAVVGIEDLLKSILKENYEIFEEQLRKFQNCFETKIAQQLKPSLRLLTLSHDSPIANIDLIACQLALQKIQFDCFVLVSNSFLSQPQLQQPPSICELSQRLQFFYDNFLPLFNDCIAQTISDSNSSTFLITTTLIPQHVLNVFEKIVLDVRLYENLFDRQFSMPKLSINSSENFAENLQKLDDGLLDMLEVAKKHEQKTSSNFENCKNECEQKIKNLQKVHEAQMRSLEMSFENKKTIFKKIADNEHGILLKKNRELQSEIDRLKNEIEASKTSIHQLCLQQYSGNVTGCGNSIMSSVDNSSGHGFCFDEIYHFDENNIRKKYQSEIEQLKILCEKGILAMESSHKRIIGEMENKHRQERKQLLIEKEQALAEETQATLSALEAMRKAHEVEVQREIVKFKEEYMRNMKSSQDIESLHKEHEIEMKDIRQEILSLSEKYTMKCIECANLEQKLCYISSQLNQGHHHHHHQNVLHIDTGHSKRRHCCYVIDTTKNILENSSEERKKLSKTTDYFLSV